LRDGSWELTARPSSIRRVEGGVLVTWRDGHEAVYAYGHLRRRCPCAECRHAPPRIVEADDPLKLFDDRPIYAENAALVGNYAVQFDWNDGHRHGIYAFDYLRSICPCPECSSSGESAPGT
jgi:DUF971 family protein